MNIYNVVLASVTVVVSSTLVSDTPTLSYVLSTSLTLVSTTILLCLLFCPKVYALWKHKDMPVVTSSGVTFEGNTRRFVVDESREKFYRAEVENRHLKRRLVQVNHELSSLERLHRLVIAYPNDLDYVKKLLIEENQDKYKHEFEPTLNTTMTMTEDMSQVSTTQGSSTTGQVSVTEDSCYTSSTSDLCSNSVLQQSENMSEAGQKETIIEEDSFPDDDLMSFEIGPPGMMTLIFQPTNSSTPKLTPPSVSHDLEDGVESPVTEDHPNPRLSSANDDKSELDEPLSHKENHVQNFKTNNFLKHPSQPDEAKKLSTCNLSNSDNCDSQDSNYDHTVNDFLNLTENLPCTDV